MNGVFGAISRDGSPLGGVLDILRAETEVWSNASGTVVGNTSVSLGSVSEHPSKSSVFEQDGGLFFSFAGRIDNRKDLEHSLHLDASERQSFSDAEVCCCAWRRWGDACCERIYGDWSLAGWDPKLRRLFVARDHSGVTVLYFCSAPRFLAFSPSRRALLNLNLVPAEMDELYLAQLLVGWTGYHGHRTAHKSIRRLPPSHCLSVCGERLEVHQYWHLADTPELVLPRHEYTAAFLERFDRAVYDRLPAEGTVALTLSGGLDSGSVAATAAQQLRREGRRLLAFTSSPVFDTAPYINPKFFGNELPLAKAVAESAGNIDHFAVDAADMCPVGAIRRVLQISMEPRNGAANAYWGIAYRQMAAERGCKVLLTGAAGNQGMSWSGRIAAQPIQVQIARLGWIRWIRHTARRQMPLWAQSAWACRRARNRGWDGTAINRDFAARVGLMDLYLESLQRGISQPERLGRWYGHGPASSSILGAAQAEMGAAFGLEIRDPTADARLLQFCFSVPDRIFIDPVSGQGRWLIREAMRGRLPDSVRLNQTVGLQAADLVPRLRRSCAAVEDALAEIQKGPGREYVSMPAMREAWQRIRKEDTPEALILAITVLTKGIMAGVFVNGLGTEW